MALENLVSVVFTDAELQQLDKAFDEIESVLKNKVINLSAKQRQQHGRVKYEMEVWVNKAFNYADVNPGLMPGYIDMDELRADHITHNQLNPRIDRLQTLLQGMLDTNLLLGTDLYSNLGAFYRSLREASKTNAPGASAIYKDLKQQFPGRPSAKADEQAPDA
ncbi:MAG: hypothetical protein JNM14_07595 [Ferruginibacter sp.]|nr:hypothetical protein [Ferruginibacter sp.]